MNFFLFFKEEIKDWANFILRNIISYLYIDYSIRKID